MKIKFLVIGLVVLGLVLGGFGCAAPKPAPTAPTEVSFEGKTITLIIPYAPGGSTDVWGRVLVKHLPKHLPGKPAMIARNMPGGDATFGSNYVYAAKPDGLTMLITSGGILLNQLIGTGAVRYDLLKMPALMGSSSGTLCYGRSEIISKREDLLKAKGLIFGYIAASGSYIFIGAKELLNIPTEKVILAYTGSGDARRAFFAGEINLCTESSAGYREGVVPYVEKGEVTPLFQSGLLDEKGEMVRDPSLPPEVPTIKELYEKFYGKSPSGMAYEATKSMVALRNYDKVFFLSPGTPDSIVRVYWAACEAMLKDLEFRKVVERLAGTEAPWKAGETFQKEFVLNFGMKPEVRDWLRGTLRKYGVVIE